MFNLDCDSETLCRILSVLGSSAPLLPHSVVRTLTGMLKLKLSMLFSNGKLKKNAEKITWYTTNNWFKFGADHELSVLYSKGPKLISIRSLILALLSGEVSSFLPMHICVLDFFSTFKASKRFLEISNYKKQEKKISCHKIIMHFNSVDIRTEISFIVTHR